MYAHYLRYGCTVCNNLEMYVRDERKLKNMTVLLNRLHKYNQFDGEEAKHVTISLFMGPKLLTSEPWRKVLSGLARKGMILMIVVDEAHYVNQSGRHFRPEFKSAANCLGELIKIMPRPVPRVLLLATLSDSNVDKCTGCLGNKAPSVLHGSLARHEIDFRVIISGNVTSSLKRCAKKTLRIDGMGNTYGSRIHVPKLKEACVQPQKNCLRNA